MGLDQYAFRIDAQTGEEGGEVAFQWRKHAKLQAFMETLFEERTGLSATDLNCGRLELTLEDIATLEQAVTGNDLPESPGGFFYGHQIQDEQAFTYQKQDLAFCAWARETLGQDAKVVYSCWW